MDSPTNFPSLVFADGVVATMTSIHIRHTYADYIECRPCPLVNSEVHGKLRRRLRHGRGGVLVLPADKALTDTSGPDRHAHRALPGFEMVAEFQSDATTDPSQSFSFLTIAWHQDSLSPLIEDGIKNRISKIAWFPRASHGAI